MKKAMIAMMLCMAMAFPVMAQENTQETTEETAAAGVQVLMWDDLEEYFVQAGYSGTLYTIDALGLQLVVPEGMEQRRPTEEEAETDTILVFEDEAETAKIEFVLGPISDCEDLEDVAELMSELYPEMSINETIINGYDTLVYGNEEKDSMAVLINAFDAGFLRIIMSPISDPDMNQLFSFVAASIQDIQ